MVTGIRWRDHILGLQANSEVCIPPLDTTKRHNRCGSWTILRYRFDTHTGELLRRMGRGVG